MKKYSWFKYATWASYVVFVLMLAMLVFSIYQYVQFLKTQESQPSDVFCIFNALMVAGLHPALFKLWKSDKVGKSFPALLCVTTIVQILLLFMWAEMGGLLAVLVYPIITSSLFAALRFLKHLPAKYGTE